MWLGRWALKPVRDSHLPPGLAAGALGTLALSALEPLRNRLLGRLPPYSVEHLASRGARRWLGRRLGSREARRWGLALRWVYGPCLGLLHLSLRASLPRGAPLRGLLLGGGVWLLEVLAFPRLAVTPPFRRWSPAARWLLWVQTSVFGLVTESALARQ